MQITEYTRIMLTELHGTANLLSDEAADEFADRIVSAKRIFTAGAGRSGLMMRAFAMRLMHLGLNAYVVGESVTPGIGRDDLLIIGSGSGETKSLLSMAQKAKSIGADIALVTVNPESTIGQLSDATVRIAASPKEQQGGGSATVQPMGSLFEQSLLLLTDALVLKLMDRQGIEAAAMFSKHANLE
ncbi:6-phospho-3-hexuloisomerase [Paenibacillus doosanensis]|nr:MULTISPECIES: 6-phospho-3-hexuloisomerase [Paenibacillus]MCS7462935.1 6-phospho-3-hexuloisomerase [Paenibacillus doosanensis]